MGKKRKGVSGVSYGRISTLSQMTDTDGFIKDDASPKVQKQKCEAYIKNYNSFKGVDYKIVEHLSDEGFSGGNTNRPSFQRLCDLVSRKKIKFIVASELSRLSRNVADFLKFIAMCEDNDVELMIIDLNLNTSEPMGRMMTTVLMALAEFERRLTGKRVSDNAKSRLITDGKINGSTEILGLDKCPKRRGHFVANAEELKSVVEIFKIYLRVSSKRDVLNELEKLGIKDKKGQAFTFGRLNKVFENAHYRYRGLWPLNKKNKNEDQEDLEPSKRFQLVELPHGPLVDIELLDTVLEKLEDNYSSKKKRAKGIVYLLTTLLEYEDGSTFTGQPAKQRQYFYYYNRQNDVRIRCDELDKLIMKRMKEYLKKSDIFKELISKAQKKKSLNIPSINKVIRETRSKLDQISKTEVELQESLLTSENRKRGELFLDFIENRLEAISNDREKYETQFADALELRESMSNPLQIENIKDLMESLLKNFSRLSGIQNRRMAEQIFEKIVIKSDNSVCLHIYDDISQIQKKTG